MASLHPPTSMSIPLRCQPPHHSLLESFYWYCFIYGWVCCCSLDSLAFCCIPHCSKFVATMASWRICLVGLMFSLLAEIGSKTGPLYPHQFCLFNHCFPVEVCLLGFLAYFSLFLVLFSIFSLAFRSIMHLKRK